MSQGNLSQGKFDKVILYEVVVKPMLLVLYESLLYGGELYVQNIGF